jgi:hypothetical protein
LQTEPIQTRQRALLIKLDPQQAVFLGKAPPQILTLQIYPEKNKPPQTVKSK